MRAFPGPGPRWQVSSGGGSAPVWSPDGRRIVYRGLRAGFIQASVTPGPDANTFRVDARDTVPTPGMTFYNLNAYASHDVIPDGRGIAAIQRQGGERTTFVVYNWPAELRARTRPAK